MNESLRIFCPATGGIRQVWKCLLGIVVQRPAVPVHDVELQGAEHDKREVLERVQDVGHGEAPQDHQRHPHDDERHVLAEHRHQDAYHRTCKHRHHTRKYFISVTSINTHQSTRRTQRAYPRVQIG